MKTVQRFINCHLSTVRIDYLLEWDESIVVSSSNQWSTLTVETFRKWCTCNDRYYVFFLLYNTKKSSLLFLKYVVSLKKIFSICIHNCKHTWNLFLLLAGYKVYFIAPCEANKSIFLHPGRKKIVCNTGRTFVLLAWVSILLKLNFFSLSKPKVVYTEKIIHYWLLLFTRHSRIAVKKITYTTE